MDLKTKIKLKSGQMDVTNKIIKFWRISSPMLTMHIYSSIERLNMHLLLLQWNNRCGFYSNDIPWHWRPEMRIMSEREKNMKGTGRWLLAIINIFNVWLSIFDSSKSHLLRVCLNTLCCMHSIGDLYLGLGTINNNIK